jgi:hypothetical protein
MIGPQNSIFRRDDAGPSDWEQVYDSVLAMEAVPDDMERLLETDKVRHMLFIILGRLRISSVSIELWTW